MGIFEKQRKAEQITEYSELIQLDFDKVNNPIEKLIQIKNDKFVYVVLVIIHSLTNQIAFIKNENQID